MLVVGLGEWWKSDSENVINKALKSDQSLMLRAEATILGKVHSASFCRENMEERSPNSARESTQAGCVNLDVLEVPRSRTGFIGDKNSGINLKQASIALKQGKSMIIAGLAESKKDHAIELLAKLEVGMNELQKITEDRKREVVVPKQKESLQ
ncbi:hypothetical protein Tco_0708738 [Tanacetum coccineum]